MYLALNIIICCHSHAYSRNKTDLRTNPWGTPDGTEQDIECSPDTITCWVQLVRKDFIQCFKLTRSYTIKI